VNPGFLGKTAPYDLLSDYLPGGGEGREEREEREEIERRERGESMGRTRFRVLGFRVRFRV
jgi:hypothetical protein